MGWLVTKIKNLIFSLTSEINEIPDNAVLLDVRSPEEHATGTLPGSVLMPLAEVADPQKVTAKLSDTSQPIVVYCASGGRSMKAKQQLKKMGYKKVYNGGGISSVRKLL